eukprot:scaffold109746_cov70-Phaeocystis_antarctica.AAC.1
MVCHVARRRVLVGEGVVTGVTVHNTWCVRSSGERSCRREVGLTAEAAEAAEVEETAVEATEEEVRAAEVRAAV